MRTATVLTLLLAAPSIAQTCTPRWQGFTLDGDVHALYSDIADPAGPSLLVGGAFSGPDFLARFTGSAFAAVAPGLRGEVLGLTRHDDGSGSTIYATGFLDLPVPGGWGVPYGRLREGSFRAYGAPAGPNTWTGPAISYDLGAGPRLLTSGGFGFPCSYVTEWDGSSWVCLGGGLGSIVEQGVVFDDGSGPALFVVGGFNINDIPGPDGFGIGKWNGTRWQAVGGGIDGFGRCCLVRQTPSGPELIVGGSFARVGSSPIVAASNIASWNGRRWTSLGAGTDRMVTALAVFDDGSGEKVYAAGDFTTAGDAPAQHLARWDGAAWSACPAGGVVGTGGGFGGLIEAMVTHDPDGAGPAPAELVLGGSFTAVGGGSVPALRFAVLHAGPRSADVTGDGFTDFFDYDAFVAAFESGDPLADFDRDGFADFFDYGAFVAAFETGC